MGAETWVVIWFHNCHDIVFFRGNNTSGITDPCASTNQGLITLQSQPRPIRHAQDVGDGADEDFSFLALVHVTAR